MSRSMGYLQLIWRNCLFEAVIACFCRKNDNATNIEANYRLDNPDEKPEPQSGYLLTRSPGDAASHLTDWMDGVVVYLARANLENGKEVSLHNGQKAWFYREDERSSLRMHWFFNWVASKKSKLTTHD